MVAEIQVLDAKGEMATGQYSINWISPTRWREEFRFGNYQLLRVHNADGYWQKSGLAFEPQVIFRLEKLLNYENLLTISPHQGLGKLKTRGKDGVRQSCVDVRWSTATDRTLCFDDSTGNFLSAEFPTHEHQNAPQISRIEFSTFKPVGGKTLPFEMRALDGRKTVALVKVLDLTQNIEPAATLFGQPEGSEFWASCDGVQPAELANHISPKYPQEARLKHEYGRVSFYAVIEADGNPSHLTLIQNATPLLEAAAADAIRQWHYKPPTCGSTPIRTSTEIEVDFWLER
jgi:TonB family protein